jgi:hypothetical protein
MQDVVELIHGEHSADARDCADGIAAEADDSHVKGFGFVSEVCAGYAAATRSAEGDHPDSDRSLGRFAHSAHYGDFVQLERRKANGQFGATRTVVSVMPNGVGAIDAV